MSVLTKQVEEISNGSISQRAMGLAMSIGVCVSVGLAMVRVLTGPQICIQQAGDNPNQLAPLKPAGEKLKDQKQPGHRQGGHIMSLGLGIASTRSDKNSASDSFGLISLCSIGPEQAHAHRHGEDEHCAGDGADLLGQHLEVGLRHGGKYAQKEVGDQNTILNFPPPVR